MTAGNTSLPEYRTSPAVAKFQTFKPKGEEGTTLQAIKNHPHQARCRTGRRLSNTAIAPSARTQSGMVRWLTKRAPMRFGSGAPGTAIATSSPGITTPAIPS